ncbi:hypothetical protein [Micromonospora avicenniae]|uniref:hypothetical protein n=1 Tax=Micromonospora avicenniae TaxID=1198245 RepID=UPI00333394E4
MGIVAIAAVKPTAGYADGRRQRDPITNAPWPHLYLAEALPAGYAWQLAADFRSHVLKPSARSNSDKDYSPWTADLTGPSAYTTLTPGLGRAAGRPSSGEY